MEGPRTPTPDKPIPSMALDVEEITNIYNNQSGMQSPDHPAFTPAASPPNKYPLNDPNSFSALLPLTSPLTVTKMSRRVSFSCESDFVYTKHSGDGGGVGAVEVGGKKKKATLKIWIFKFRRSSCAAFSPASFFRHIGAKVAGALPFMSTTTQKRCSRKVSSSASLVRSRSYAETLDSQRAEAIEDCIEFLNSSSSLQRSNSVASSC